ncbi:hypothetical protein L226DRAFT_275255 [Lentinus tigrinus ALCF2SS1-7]|uniref:uncharacterized protein n=1 Tax=Lentinus tigrinus ALCF2SS1-7 TaxID=1328758 RepID=UPI001165CFE5|nr:hypothetical protein L226DRAFT_275255 [Lentinus tigrinus ALCF2SS1-7]
MATSVHSATVGDTNALGENITPDHGSDRDMNSEPQTKGALPDDTAWRFPTADEILQELSQEFTSEEKERVWTEASDAVKAYYDRLLVRWKEEMDTLLVYAGVSSAVMTAFIVESYKLLQPDPTDVTVAVLKQISTQLNSFTISPPFVNVTQVDQSASATHAPFRAPSSAIWLNALWFSSLVFSLGSALLALFVKQWIYEATVGGNSRESARLRQHRLNGLLQWRVGTIVVVLPIMLQLASILFLGGLVLLLWTLHAAVATVASLLVGILFTFFLTVTILPVFRSDCSYRSPASLAIYVILRHIRNTTMENIRRICKVLDRWYAALRLRCGSPKVSFLHQFAYNRRYLSTWRGRDQNDIHNQLGAIDRAILTTAYSTTIDTKFVSDMPVVFSDLPPHEVTRCFVDICNFMEGEWGDRGIQQRLLDDPTTLPRISCYGLRHILARPDKGTKAWVDDIAKIFRYYTLGREPTERFVEFAFKTLCQLAVESLTYKTIYGSAYVVLSRFYDQQKAHHTYDTLCHE